MTDRELISAVVDETISKLKIAGLMRNETQTVFQKTEWILRNYNIMKNGHGEDGTADKFVGIIDAALETISDDEYYNIIPMIYFDELPRETVAEYFDTTVTTISRNKTRLVNKLKVYIFTDDIIKELFL